MYRLHENRPNARTWRRQFQIGPELLQQITAAGFKALAYIGLLEAIAKRDRPWQTPIIQCRQRTIAAACGVDRSHINRVINHCLVPIGLLDRTRRAPQIASGKFQSCLYELTTLAKRLLGTQRAPAPRRSNRVMYPAQGSTGTHSSSIADADFLSTGPPYPE